MSDRSNPGAEDPAPSPEAGPDSVRDAPVPGPRDARDGSPLERARAVARARAGGRSLRSIARELGVSVKQARRYEELAGHPQELQELIEERRLPMAHAKLLADAGVDDPREWVQRWSRHRWTASELRRELLRSEGRKPGGRRRTYLRREENALRVYAFRISRSAPAGERARVIRVLQQAIEFLRED